IPYLNETITCKSIGSPTAELSLIFAHGTTLGISSPAIMNFAEGSRSFRKLTQRFEAVCRHERSDVIGGRSMGSRSAIVTAKKFANVKALILHLLFEIDKGVDVLLAIGDKDDNCDLNELEVLRKQMKVKTWLVVVSNANHRMDINSPEATEAIGKMVGRIAARWIDERDENLTNSRIKWDEEKKDVIVDPWN
ncbi:hypothetical protein Bhyg_00751, partial [Pseudolycoriella hygida]